MSASAGPYEVPLKESAGGRKQRRSMPGWASRVCGAVVSTSTKTDLYLSTAAIRVVIAAG